MELLKTRTIDDLGRISLGSKTMNELGWREKTTVEIHKLDAKTLVLRYDPTPLSEQELEEMKSKIGDSLVIL